MRCESCIMKPPLDIAHTHRHTRGGTLGKGQEKHGSAGSAVEGGNLRTKLKNFLPLDRCILRIVPSLQVVAGHYDKPAPVQVLRND